MKWILNSRLSTSTMRFGLICLPVYLLWANKKSALLTILLFICQISKQTNQLCDFGVKIRVASRKFGAKINKFCSLHEIIKLLATFGSSGTTKGLDFDDNYWLSSNLTSTFTFCSFCNSPHTHTTFVVKPPPNDDEQLSAHYQVSVMMENVD